jgi:uncharacterized protein (TIGR03083 family)
VTPKPPVDVLDLFPRERECLLQLLAALPPDRWSAPTACPGWSVKDLAAHLLGDDLGKLARDRDRPARQAAPAAPSWDDLVALVDRLNQEWVVALRRLSPRVLTDLLAWSGARVQAYFRSLDPMALGRPVSWAGPDPAPTWLDVAREYTERWLHQEQIREAVGAPGLRDRALFHPVLDTFVHALPRAYREVGAAGGTHVRLVVSGDAGGEWSLVRQGGRWGLFVAVETPPACVVSLHEDLAWRLFTRGVDVTVARRRCSIEGDEALGVPALRAVAIVA